MSGRPRGASFEPTPETVRALWRHMTGLYGTRVVDKASAVEMRLAAFALGKMGVLDPEAFMRRYTTTVGRRIYVPFEVGRPDERHDLWSQVVVCAHEHQHVEQLLRDGWLRFAGRYLLSSAARAAYEAEAYRSNLELAFWRTGEVPDPGRLAARLRDYGCTGADVAMAQRMLELSAETVRRGGVANRASQKVIAWLEAHALGPEPEEVA